MKVSARLLSSNDIESYLDQIKERFDYDKADNDLEYAVCRSVEFGASVMADLLTKKNISKDLGIISLLYRLDLSLSMDERKEEDQCNR